MAIYKGHSIKIHNDGGSAVIVRDITDERLELSPEVIREVTMANTTPDHVAVHGIKPKLSFSTYDLVNVLDTIGLIGLGITSATNPGVVLFLQKMDNVGGVASGSVHRSYTCGDGLIVPRTLACDHQGDFKLTCEMGLIWDGTNNPVVLADNVALPSISSAPARWTLGGITIGNVALTNYTNVSIDFGNNYTTRGGESKIYDTSIEQKTHEPSITITGIDPAWFIASGGVPIGGVVVANSTDYLYLRKRSQDGDHFVGNATAEHIKFTLAGLACIDGAANVVAQRVSETTLMIYGAKDSSGNMPLVVDTTSAIS